MCSDEATAVTAEENLTGTLLIKSENDNKYGGLKRLIIKSINQGHNRFPSIKAAAYNIFWKYVPELTKNENKSRAMRDRTATGVSFYQRATPVDVTQVTVKNGINGDMITC